MPAPKKVIFFIALVALFATVTNFVYVSPILTFLLPLSLFVFDKKKLPRPIFWLYIYTLLFVAGAVLYDWHSIFEFGFYRRDGNFIISYAPLLVLPLFSFEADLEKYFRYFFLFVFILYGALFFYHFATLHDFSNLFHVIFGGLFVATNAVGGFLAIIACLAWAYYYNSGQKKDLFFFGVIFVIMLSTYSRGAVLGFMAGILAWYCTITKRFKWLIAVIAVPVFLTAACIYVGYPYFSGVISTHEQVKQNFSSDVSTKNVNVLIRIFYTFPRAWYIFKHSPIVGTGVGSYDDRPLQLKKVAPGIYYNADVKKYHTNRTAHHSFLNIMAEQGLVGLALFLVFWVSLFFHLNRIRGAPLLRDFFLLAYFTITFISFTGHRLTTPSNMLPFTIMLGLFMTWDGTAQTYRIKRNQAK